MMHLAQLAALRAISLGNRLNASTTGNVLENDDFTVMPGVTTRTVRSSPARIVAQTGADYVQFSGDGMWDFEHYVTTLGRFQLDGSDSDPPIAMLRVSRAPAGSSRNHSIISTILFTGQSTLAHFVNDGQECFLCINCQFLQDRDNGCCVEISNVDRESVTEGIEDPENRATATTSGCMFLNCTFAVEGGSISTGATGGASVRIRGQVTELEFHHCWFAGNAPIRIVDESDEALPVARNNTPNRITFHNCTAEGSGEVTKIRRYGVPAGNITLSGWSSTFFTVVDGDA